MVPDTHSATPGESPPADDYPNTLLNGLIGGLVGIVFAFVPLSTVLGGALAGYLEGSGGNGSRAGAVAGVVMLVPFLLIGSAIVYVLLGVVPLPWASPAFVVVLVLGAAYTVGLAGLGGVLGVYLRREL